MAARPRRTELGKPLRLASWNAVGVRGRKLELGHFLSQHGVDNCLLNETLLNQGQAFRLANYVCHRKTELQWGRQSHSIPPWYSPPLSARSGPDQLRSYCQPSHSGRQIDDSRCGQPYAFPPTDRSGPHRLFRRGTAGRDGRRPKRQTRGLEFAA